jgi:hypothetical protein
MVRSSSPEWWDQTRKRRLLHIAATIVRFGPERNRS